MFDLWLLQYSKALQARQSGSGQVQDQVFERKLRINIVGQLLTDQIQVTQEAIHTGQRHGCRDSAKLRPHDLDR